MKRIISIICAITIFMSIFTTSVYAYNQMPNYSYNESEFELQSFENSPLFIENTNGSGGTISRSFEGSASDKKYAPKGALWTYSYGGPTSATVNYRYKYKRVEYISPTDVVMILGQRYDTGIIGAIASGGISFVIKVAQGKGYISFVKYAQWLSAAYGAVGAIKILNEEADYGAFKRARDKGAGIMLEYYLSSYQGVWNEQRVRTEWKCYPYAAIPPTSFGVGTIKIY